MRARLLPEVGKIDLRSELGVSGLICGSGSHLCAGWLNVDGAPLRSGDKVLSAAGRVTQLLDANATPHYYLQHDCTEPFPLPDASVARVHSEHMIEHLTLAGGIAWLKEMRRVLQPGGVLRVTTPDLQRYVAGYLDPEQAFYREHQQHLSDVRMEGYLGLPSIPERRAWMINQIFRYYGHLWIYDLDELVHAATEAGFRPVALQQQAFGHSLDPALAALDRPERRDETLYVDIIA
ncbi:MAG: methyltransferase domain-containing protein [Gammaproteobacteria bacterium]|nr:methyltransferase domain-containing protein [Gammaproteobacteria bacterium]